MSARLSILSFLFSFLTWSLHAQSDDCNDALLIPNVVNYCSEYGQFNNYGATPSSGIPQTICISNETTMHDVWFKFTAVNNFLNLKVIGADPTNLNGTLTQPQVMVFSGSCDNLTLIHCSSDGFSTNQINTYAGPLVPGQTYYILVSAENDGFGSFQMCLNNYNQVYEPESDCTRGKVLCDKSSVYIEKVVGNGLDTNEVDKASCASGEYASSWFRWTCSKSGTLTFVLSPIELDDIDFILYELPGGIDDCSNKISLRCGAAGETRGAPITDWIHCYGPTGLNFESTDIEEGGGCANGQDRFVKYVDLVEGRSYALLVNNFTQSSFGFNMEFGGTAEFLGARAHFEILDENTCYEDTIRFINTSVAPTDPIVRYEWSFGNNASPMNSNLTVPPPIIYNNAGYKTVSLTITSQDGCVHTYNETFIAKCCNNPLQVILQSNIDSIKWGNLIELNTTINNQSGSVNFEWHPLFNVVSNCFDCPDLTVLPIQSGAYYVTVRDERGCIANDSIFIRVFEDYGIYAPNVFSPNFDGINDHFTLFSNAGVKKINRLLVFNRWGACVYEGQNIEINNENQGWDGTFKGQQCNPDVFAWFAEVEFINQETRFLKGDLTLIR